MLFIFDMDGVLYRGSEPVPYAAAAVAELRRAGHIIRFLTNNASKARADYIPRLASMDISCAMEEIVTSAFAAAEYIVAQGWKGATVNVVGEQGLRDELTAVAGCRMLDTDSEVADIVVAGIDRQFTYQKMKVAQQHLLAGAHFVATNRDATFPVEGGRVVPGAGSVVAGLVTSSGREPFTVGKPNPYSITLLAEQTGTPLSEVVAIGDRLDTDIDAGIAAGVRTLLVLTGVSSRGESDARLAAQRPSMILDDLSHLPREWVSA